jgi:hypothetical protein
VGFFVKDKILVKVYIFLDKNKHKNTKITLIFEDLYTITLCILSIIFELAMGGKQE